MKTILLHCLMLGWTALAAVTEAAETEMPKATAPATAALGQSVLSQQADTLMEIVAAEAEIYPLDRCPISGELLGSMGDPEVVMAGATVIKLCCASCVEGARERADSIHKAIIKALVKRDGSAYPLVDCVACGNPLPRKPQDLVAGSTLVRVCSKTCADGLEEQAEEWSLRIRLARAAANLVN